MTHNYNLNRQTVDGFFNRRSANYSTMQNVN